MGGLIVSMRSIREEKGGVRNPLPTSGAARFHRASIGGPPRARTPDATLRQVESERELRVTLNWTNKNIPQTLQMSTYISQYGMQRYIY